MVHIAIGTMNRSALPMQLGTDRTLPKYKDLLKKIRSKTTDMAMVNFHKYYM